MTVLVMLSKTAKLELRNVFRITSRFDTADLTMPNFTTEAQRTQSFPCEMFLCDLCASVVRNLQHETGKLIQTHC